jgi:hypothetical protein
MPLFTLVTDPGPVNDRPTRYFLAEHSQHRVALISAAATPERVLVRLGGTDRELAGPLLAAGQCAGQGLTRARRPGPGATLRSVPTHR